MRLSRWMDELRVSVIPKENRPDAAQYATDKWQYDLKGLFFTLNGSWEVGTVRGSMEQWARDEYLKPPHDPLYCRGGGGDHHAHMRVVDEKGQAMVGKGLWYWHDRGLEQLASPDGSEIIQRVTDNNGWENIPIEGWLYYPAQGPGPGWMCPVGYSDVVGGFGMPDNWHISTFAAYRRRLRGKDFSTLEEAIIHTAKAAQVLSHNPEAAIQKHVGNPGPWPLSDETDVIFNGEWAGVAQLWVYASGAEWAYFSTNKTTSGQWVVYRHLVPSD